MERITIVCGHYGSGKTNLALNMALNEARGGKRVTLVDLDVVNPYFRTADYTEYLSQRGVDVIAQNLEGTTVDAPAITARMFSVFNAEIGRVIIDVGGDDAGATALGRFSHLFRDSGYEMIYVVNRYRKFISDAGPAAALLGEIEAACRLSASKIANNSHLGALTRARDVLDALPYARQVSDITGLPLGFTTAPLSLCDELSGKVDNLYPVEILVKLPWDN